MIFDKMSEIIIGRLGVITFYFLGDLLV